MREQGPKVRPALIIGLKGADAHAGWPTSIGAYTWPDAARCKVSSHSEQPDSPPWEYARTRGCDGSLSVRQRMKRLVLTVFRTVGAGRSCLIGFILTSGVKRHEEHLRFRVTSGGPPEPFRCLSPAPANSFSTPVCDADLMPLPECALTRHGPCASAPVSPAPLSKNRQRSNNVVSFGRRPLWPSSLSSLPALCAIWRSRSKLSCRFPSRPSATTGSILQR